MVRAYASNKDQVQLLRPLQPVAVHVCCTQGSVSTQLNRVVGNSGKEVLTRVERRSYQAVNCWDQFVQLCKHSHLSAVFEYNGAYTRNMLKHTNLLHRTRIISLLAVCGYILTPAAFQELLQLQAVLHTTYIQI